MNKTKVTTHKQPLIDAFGRELNIGDIVLGAKGRPNNYVETVYMHSIVVGRTKAMLRLIQIDSYNLDKSSIEEVIERRGNGGGGGKINPAETILVMQGFLSEQEIEDALTRGKLSTNVQLVPASWVSPTALTPAKRTSKQVFGTPPTNLFNP